MRNAAVKWGLFLLCIVVIRQPSRAQQILFRNYSVADGLCANTVWAVSQDDQGYMWFGTKDGLNRFDGYQFKSYRFSEDDSLSIGCNWITTIFNYTADSCWIGTEKGIYILDMKQEQFHFFEPIGVRSIFDIIRDKKGNIWVATGSGVFKYDCSSKKLKQFVHHPGTPNSLSLSFVRRLLLDNAGRIWMGTAWKGIDIYDPATGLFNHLMATGEPGSLSSNFITDLYKDKSGRIWVGTEKGGLNLWNKTSRTFTLYQHDKQNSISDNIIHDIYQPEPGKLYIGTEKGVDILDVSSGDFTNYSYHSSNPYSLSDNAVYAIFQDKAGGIWIGTYFGGVNYFHPRHTNFELYYPTGGEKSISGKAVSAMLQADSTHIWIGTEDGGLNYFNTKTKAFKHYPFTPGQEKLSYHNIHALIKDRAGNIWIGTFTGGINVYHPKTGKVKVYKFGSNSGASSYSNMIYDIYQDSKGTIWVGTVGRLFRYDPEQEKFLRVNVMNLNGSWVYDIYEDQKHNLWVGTYNNGLFKKDAGTNKWRHYNIHSERNRRTSEKIICIQPASASALWLGTDGGGLYLFNKETSKSVSYKDKYGLNADIVYGILKDKGGDLWLSTNNGLFAFDPGQKLTRHYTQWDHLQGKQFNYKSYLKTMDGKFYFGGVNGLNAFYPDSIRYLKAKPEIVFTNFQLFNKNVSLKSADAPLHNNITYTDHLTLSHNQSMFSIEYAALNYIAPHKTHYAYKMEGYDEHWNYVDNQRKATYTNLPAGDYVFKVKATDNNGKWMADPATIALTIRPPFYKTTLAYVIYALLLITAVWFFRRMEIRRIKKKNLIKIEREQNRKEHQFYKQKIDFFTSMAHEIRTPLSLIIAPLEKLIQIDHWEPEVKEQLAIMDNNSNRLLTLTNQLLDFRRLESDVYKIHTEKIEIVSLVHNLFSRFSSISYQKGINFSIDSKISKLEVKADPEALTKILSNLLINAFKFTRKKVRICINTPFIKEGSSFFSISIEDDGIGIPEEDITHVFEKFYQVSSGSHEYHNLGGNGIGLALAKTLTEKHQGTLRVESEQNVRTVFTVNIPFVPIKPAAIKPDMEQKRAAVENKTDKKDPKDTKTILIVEDDLSLLDFISRSIKEAGFKPFKAKNGKEALGLLDKNSIDLVISDVMMPEMDGLKFCKHMKEDMSYSHVPLILLTARANMEVEIEGIESGADAYITKPFKWKHVLAVVHNLLESRLKLKEKFSQQPFAEPGSLVTNSGDRKFLDKVIEIINQRMDDPQLSVEVLSDELSMSRSSLHKKLKAISGHVPNEFVRIIRLKHAAKLLLRNEYSISEIGYMTGFNSPSYFSKCFNKQFKVSPKEFTERELKRAQKAKDSEAQ